MIWFAASGVLLAFFASLRWGQAKEQLKKHRVAFGVAGVGLGSVLLGAVCLWTSRAAAVHASLDIDEYLAYLRTLASSCGAVILALLTITGMLADVYLLVVAASSLLCLGSFGGLFALSDLFIVQYHMDQSGDDSDQYQINAGFVLLWLGSLAIMAAAVLRSRLLPADIASGNTRTNTQRSRKKRRMRRRRSRKSERFENVVFASLFPYYLLFFFIRPFPVVGSRLPVCRG